MPLSRLFALDHAHCHHITWAQLSGIRMHTLVQVGSALHIFTIKKAGIFTVDSIKKKNLICYYHIRSPTCLQAEFHIIVMVAPCIN